MRTVLFDLDGTLVDSLPGLTVALNALLTELGRANLTLAEVRGYIGHGAPYLLAAAAEHTGGPFERDQLPRYRTLCTQIAAFQTEPFAGISDMLDRLPARVGLVTSKPEESTMALLRELGWLNRFEVIVGGDTLSVRKPDPAPLRHAMQAMGVESEQVIYVGDSDVDQIAAERAGVGFVGVGWGYGRFQAAPVHTVAELEAALNR